MSGNFTLLLKVETPATFSCLAKIVDWFVVTPTNVERPATLISFVKIVVWLVVMPVNVETPVTVKSVSTFKEPSISTVLLKIAGSRTKGQCRCWFTYIA